LLETGSLTLIWVGKISDVKIIENTKIKILKILQPIEENCRILRIYNQVDL
jgi:hypothetical protein